MTWVPKSTAPSHFSLADEFIALITGDPTWGWLVDWATLIPNLPEDTVSFCAAGPPGSVDLSVVFGPSPPDRNPIATAAKIVSIGAALVENARDRVFGAFCELPGGGGIGFGPATCVNAVSNPRPPSSQLLVRWPLGTTQSRVIVTNWVGGTGGDRDLKVSAWPDTGGVYAFNDPNGTQAAGHDFGTALPATTAGWIVWYPYGTNDYSATICVQFNNTPLPGDHTPTAQPQPAGLTSPLQTVDPTLDGIAAESARLEFKLDNLLSLVQSIAGATLDLGGPTGDAADLPPDTPVDVVDAVGCIITASGIPASRSLDFGSPQNVVKLGRVNFGTAVAWYPSVWLTHTPMVIRPFPPGTTRVNVTDLPPGVTCSIAMIQRNK